MTRYKVEFEIAVKNEDSEEALKHFQTQFNAWRGNTIPARDGWAPTNGVSYTKVEEVPWPQQKSKYADDKRWKAILEKVEEMSKDTPMSMRGQAMESEAHPNKSVVTCKAVFYDDKTCTSKSMYLISAYENTVKFRGELGAIIVEVDGPYEDADDAYWTAMADSEGNAIITPDWTHYTISKDNPEAVRHGGGGFGGAEFRFEIESMTVVQELIKCGLDVKKAKDEYAEFEQITWILTTRNCWHQGVIPRKHRHLFKVNAEMVKGTPATVMIP